MNRARPSNSGVTMTNVVIKTQSLSKNYGEHQALKSVSLEISRGEVFGFLGHNGAGKTTTIHILTTLLKPTSGTAEICGHDVVRDSLEVRRHIGYVPENVRLYDSLTAHDNLKFFADLSGIENAEERISETLEFLESGHLAERRVGSFSKGLRQRIGLAQAILHRPEVLFLDEPTSGLDPLGIKTLRDLIVRLNKEFGITVFMNTHLISEIARTCTTIGVLSHGQLVYRDTIENVTRQLGDDASLEELYLSVTPIKKVGEAA
jgi:ABC-2 type transport system ATP-binding protein